MTIISSEDRALLYEETFNAVLQAGSDRELHEQVMRYAEAVGYSAVMNFDDDQWHFGKHAEVAESAELLAAAALFSMAWQYALHVNEPPEMAAIARDEIADKYRNQYLIFSASEGGFWSNDDGWVDTSWSATRFTEQETKDLSLPMSATGDAIWMTSLQAEEKLKGQGQIKELVVRENQSTSAPGM